MSDPVRVRLPPIDVRCVKLICDCLADRVVLESKAGDLYSAREAKNLRHDLLVVLRRLDAI